MEYHGDEDYINTECNFNKDSYELEHADDWKYEPDYLCPKPNEEVVYVNLNKKIFGKQFNIKEEDTL